ncbi:hypothetical protein BamMEX5DRAFT_2028 [Burkholderia ambifaria MEX-5]|uniref:Uncharacterized protein n=1 Tax=Burkholderia ambifaria MEX-5 TaxID=396597 RepID=B1T2L2_9BURK|nr:hypothetical protein BamMEX5DRAFT_2028 [Burkholderia ambifaria MEX-5]
MRLAVALEALEQRDTRAGRTRTVLILAGQPAECERRIGEQADAIAMRELGQAVLERAVQQAVRVLDACDARQPELLGRAQELRDAPRRFVRHADRADLAGLHEFREHTQRFLDRHRIRIVDPRIRRAAECRRAAIGPVQLVQVDIVGLQALEAAVERLGQVLAIELVAFAADVARIVRLPRRARDLRREHDPVALRTMLREPGADVLLRAALGVRLRRDRVHLRGVDQRDALPERVIDLLVGVALRILLAPRHRAETDQADLDARIAECAVFHAVPVTSVESRNAITLNRTLQMAEPHPCRRPSACARPSLMRIASPPRVRRSGDVGRPRWHAAARCVTAAAE